MPLDPSSTALDIPIIAFVSNKGGVTKTTTAAATAVQLAKAGFRVRVADLDAGQDTLTDWHRDRVRLGIEPTLSVQLYRTPADALRDARDYDILILDGPAKASTSTLAIAKAATLVVHPVQPSLADMRPAVKTFNELVNRDIPRERLRFLLARVDTDAEGETARAYLNESGFGVIDGWIPNRPAYRQAQDGGRAITEASYVGLRETAKKVIRGLVKEATKAYE
jgi:chromosome partitioning protein